MARPGPANDEERLPWLEPYRDTIAAKQRAARRSHGGLVAVAGALAVLVAAGGGYVVGQRTPAPPAPSAEIAVKEAPLAPAPVAQPAAPPTVDPQVPAAAEPIAIPTPAPQPVRRIAQASPRRPVRQHYARLIPARRARIEQARLGAIAVHRSRPAPRIAYRPWPKMPSPGPAGQVIQLGAFTNPTRANVALRMRLARYPALTRMPRVVVPVITRPTGQILYVLRLGTTSRQQSAIVCRNLRASGDHCLVIG